MTGLDSFLQKYLDGILSQYGAFTTFLILMCVVLWRSWAEERRSNAANSTQLLKVCTEVTSTLERYRTIMEFIAHDRRGSA